MRRLVDRVYWTFFAGSAGSVVLAIFTLFRPESITGQEIAPVFGIFSFAQVALLLSMATLVYGMLFALPVLRRTQAEQAMLTSRAAQWEVAALTDPLTGLYNRRYLEDALKEYLREFNATEAPLAIFMLDLDHFKKVNDTHGHAAGDIVLKEVADKLSSLTRSHDVVARMGGEEFCIIAPFSDPKHIEPFAKRICDGIASMEINVEDLVLKISVSIGVCSTHNGVRNADALLQISDEKLYEAKRSGRGRACF